MVHFTMTPSAGATCSTWCIKWCIKWCVPSQAWAVFNWHMPPRLYPNLVFDLHFYYAFSPQLYGDLSYYQVSYDAVEMQSAVLELTG